MVKNMKLIPISTERSASFAALAARFFGAAMLLLFVGVVAWRAAYWSWMLLAPAVSAAPADLHPLVSMRAVQARHWFGVLVERPAEAAVAAPVIKSNLTLRGVFAGGARSAALIEFDGKRQAAFLVGDEVQEGAKLDEVHPDYVTIRRGAATERLRLHEKPNGNSTAKPAIPTARPGTNTENND